LDLLKQHGNKLFFFFKGSPQERVHQYLFSKFNVNKPDEMKAATMLLADALKDPFEDFAK
jgi:hypothetical protein